MYILYFVPSLVCQTIDISVVLVYIIIYFKTWYINNNYNFFAIIYTKNSIKVI